MSSTQNDFDQLRTLLACKRYEQPPPGYFHHFSGRVRARIEVDQGTQTADWWSWLTEKFQTKPVLACTGGLAVSSLMLVGLNVSPIVGLELAEMPPWDSPGLAEIPNQPVFPRATASSAFFERPVVAYSTSLSPAFRQEPVESLHRGSSLRMQTASFTFAH